MNLPRFIDERFLYGGIFPHPRRAFAGAERASVVRPLGSCWDSVFSSCMESHVCPELCISAFEAFCEDAPDPYSCAIAIGICGVCLGYCVGVANGECCSLNCGWCCSGWVCWPCCSWNCN